MYLMAWRRNWFLGLFVGVAFLSFFWTIYFPGTLYRTLILLSVTMIAAYTGFRFSERDLVIFVAVVVATIAFASLLLAALVPNAAIMPNPPYTGLWRGIFWHKIYLGATMALGCVAYLVILFSPASKYPRPQKLFAAAMLVICTTLAIWSDSASGLVTLTAQVGLFILVLIWLTWGHLVPRWAYWTSVGVTLLGLFLLLINLEFVFGLFNRSITMTGRTPLWTYLLEIYVTKRPFLGHGFGAFWLQPGISQTVQAVVKWGYPIKVSDNGYLDVLLELGIAGLVLVLFMLVVAFRRVIPQAIRARNLTAFFSFFMLVHIVLINISLSYLVQMESFIWFLLVTVLFISAKYSRRPFLLDT
jgi:O-antigen ligase